MKKFYYIALFCVLQAQINVMALDENNNTTTWAEWIDRNIWNANKWSTAIHENANKWTVAINGAGHTTQAIQDGAKFSTPGFTTIIPRKIILNNGDLAIAKGYLKTISLS